MIRSNSRKAVFTLVVAAVGAVLLLLFFLVGPPKILATSDAPAFCGGCHVMETEYDAWAHAGAHRRKQCVDCHLPNEHTGVHYLWKGIDGMKDVVLYYSGMVPGRIRLTEHGETVVQANCIRCHEQTVMFINHGRKCWDCHRRIAHTRSGAMQTL